MNTLAIGIRYNRKVKLVGLQWPTVATLKAMARYEVNQLGRKVKCAVGRVSMAFAMPAAALA